VSPPLEAGLVEATGLLELVEVPAEAGAVWVVTTGGAEEDGEGGGL